MRHLLTVLLLLIPTFVLADTPPPMVVRIFVMERDGNYSMSSGTLIRSNLVITNHHAVRDRAKNGEIRVLFPDWEIYAAEIVKTDRKWDLAVLRIDSGNRVPVTLAEQVPKKGDTLTVGGYGSGWYESHAGHLIMFVMPSRSTIADIMQIDAQVRQGDSGGPIFNGGGKLAGVLFGGASDGTYGAHINRVKKFLMGVD